MDYLIRGEFVFTMRDDLGSSGILENGALFVSGKNIVEVGPYKELKTKYSSATVVGSPSFWVMPGFVNAHQHGKGVSSFQLGNIDESFELSRVKAAPPAKVPPYLDTLYAAMRMIEAGVTTCLHYNASRSPAHYETDVYDRLRAYQEAGIRVSFGLDIRNRNHVVYGDQEFVDTLPTDLLEKTRKRTTQSRTADPDQYFRIAEQLCDEMIASDRIKLFLTPAGPQWCTEELLKAIQNFAHERQLGVQIHLLETKYQRAYFLRTQGITAAEWLDQLGFLVPTLSVAHGVWLSERDIELLAQRGTALVHNPSSNLRLKSGIAPLSAIHHAGIPVALGLDSSGINDDMDMLQEMRLSANLQRIPGVSSQTVSNHDILRMGTTAGSRILGWGNSCGTLAPGKQADMILIDTKAIKKPFLAPQASPIDALLYRGRSSDVDTVIVAGEILYQEKKHRRLNPKAIMKQLDEAIRLPQSSDTDPLDAELFPHILRFYQAWDDDLISPRYIVNSL